MVKAPYQEQTDEELIARIRSGETGVTEYLLEKYKPLVKKQARTMYLMGGENEDLIQEGMIGLFRAISTYRQGEGSFYGFALLCINRQMYTAVQASARKKHEPLNAYVSLDEEPQMPLEDSPETMLLLQEKEGKREDMIARHLSSLEKKVLALYLEGMSYGQIAEQIGRPEKSVDNAIQRLKKKLKKVEKSVDTRETL
ncbi:sigma-70 family RNA polymerase sigma factor [Clostridiaceae bacterium Marseille-Q4145]|nr:sigma-70 family RNA polymerase sigma factor [Clostridiaceae bacterium Marseille-Q4145]